MAFELEFRPFPETGGPLSYALVPWDSELFGLPVYELRFLDEGADDAGVVARWLSGMDPEADALVCTKVDQRAVPLLESLAGDRFYPVETVLELEGALDEANYTPVARSLPVLLRPAVEADLPAMSAVAGSAFWSDRFHLDPNLSDAAADRRYVRWVESAMAAGESVFAYERTDSGAVIGFYHVRPASADTVDLMLMALDPTLTGLGLGTELYKSGMRECARMGFVTAQTRVAACNLASLNTFMRLGLSVRGVKTALHRYIPASRG